MEIVTTYCSSLERIILPSTVTDIGQQAFEGCKSLREVVLNEGLEKIGGVSFQNCKSLESINSLLLSPILVT